MKVRILSLRGIEFEGEAVSLNAKTVAGEVTILDHHRPLLSILQPGELKLVGAASEKSFPVRSGFLEMSSDNVLTVLVD